MKTNFFLRPEIFLAFWFLAQAPATHPLGVITGRIVDDDGRPMRGLQVQALALGYRNSTRELLPRGNTSTTNDRGEFRLFWLDPGSYYVAVDPANALTRSGLGYIPSDPNASWALTYFPGTADIKNAGVVQVGAAEVDIHAIQAVALPSRLIRVRLANPRLEDSFLPFTLTVQPVAEPGGPLVAPGMPRLLGGGNGRSTFETRFGLMPGRYRLLASFHLFNVNLAGGTILTIGQGDPESVNIPVARPLTVQGQILTDGTTSSLKVVCIPDASHDSGTAVNAVVRANGRFVLEDILPGPYSIGVDGLPDTSYLSSVKLQDREVAADKFEFPADGASFNMTLSIKQDGGTAGGVVVDETGTSQASATVVLARAGDSQPSRGLRWTIANDHGAFLFRGLAPGTYSALAFKAVPTDLLQDAALLKRIETSGTFTVSAGARLNLETIVSQQ